MLPQPSGCPPSPALGVHRANQSWATKLNSRWALIHPPKVEPGSPGWSVHGVPSPHWVCHPEGYKWDTHWDTAQLCSPIPCPASLPAPSICAGDGEESKDTSPCRRPFFPVAFVILPTQSRARPASKATVTSLHAGDVRRGSCSPAPFCPPRAAAPAGREMGLRVRGFLQHRPGWPAGGGLRAEGPQHETTALAGTPSLVCSAGTGGPQWRWSLGSAADGRGGCVKGGAEVYVCVCI